MLLLQRTLNYKVPKVPSEDAEAEAARIEEQQKIDTAEPLTEEEVAEKNSLLDKGFGDWTKKEFTAFVKACERYGRDNMQFISQDVEGKTPEEVKAYAKVFWERYKEIADHEKILAAIERGETKIQRKQEVQDLLTGKVESYKIPLQQLRFSYGQQKGKLFSEEEDRFMVCSLAEHGFGEEDSYEKIRQDARRSPLFRFDWFLKSRTATEINRRCNTLIAILEKEAEEDDDKVMVPRFIHPRKLLVNDSPLSNRRVARRSARRRRQMTRRRRSSQSREIPCLPSPIRKRERNKENHQVDIGKRERSVLVWSQTNSRACS